MKWRFDDVVTFLQVVEAGSITRAAARLNVSKSIVSKRISDLETALDVELLQRSTRHVVPTDAGRVFYDKALPLVQELDVTAEEVADRQGMLHGRLRVTAPMSFGTMHLGSIIASFALRHPKLELALDLDDRMVDLAGNGYDVAIRIGRLKDSGLVARKLCLSRRIVCCSPAYAREYGLPRSIADLASHACVDYANVHARRLWEFEPGKRGRQPSAVVMRSRVVINNGEAMRDAAIAGLGLVILPLFIAAAPLRDGRLIPALPTETPVPDTIYAVYPPTRHIAGKVRAFVDHLARELTRTPSWERAEP